MLGALACFVMLFATVAGASASTNAVTSQVRIGGVVYSSLGTGVIDLTPGVEAVVLLNYSFSSKNLKGYHVTDRAKNVVPMCRVDLVAGPPQSNTVHTCESATMDTDLDGVMNVNDSDEWITVPARSQLLVNVEALNDGPLLNDGGDVLYLKNSVGKVLTVFTYSVQNPTS